MSDAFTKYADAQPAETPAQEFNFDRIFTGTDAEQVEKAAAFIHGIKASEHDCQVLFAEDILNGSTKAANSLAKIAWLRRGFKQFSKDQRGVALAERVQNAAIHKALDKILR